MHARLWIGSDSLVQIQSGLSHPYPFSPNRHNDELNVMSGRTSGPLDRFEGNLKREYQLLDAGCHQYGISAIMFRTAKFVFFIVALLFSAYLIENGADPYLAAMTAILLISGPEGLETWLVHRGVINGDLERGDGGDGEA